MLPVLQIGPLAIQTPGLVLILGLWLGLTLSERVAPHFQVNPNDIYNLVFNGLIAGVIGARLFYVARYLEIFIAAPLNIISLNPGLLDPVGGLAAGCLTALIYGNRKKLSLWPILDAITPLLAVFAIALGLSQLASGDAFGIETDLPWAIEMWGAKRHPVQIYQALAAFIIFSIIWPRKRGANSNLGGGGETFWLFLALSAAARLFLEAFRGDSLILGYNIRTVQVLTWIGLAVSLWGLRTSKMANAKHL